MDSCCTRKARVQVRSLSSLSVLLVTVYQSEISKATLEVKSQQCWELLLCCKSNKDRTQAFMKVQGEGCIPDSLHHFVSSIFYCFMFPCPSEEHIILAKSEVVRTGHSTFLWTCSLGSTHCFPHATHRMGFQYLFIATDRIKLSCKVC